MAAEITLKLKELDKSLTKKMTVYHEITASVEDETIDDFIKKTTKEFNPVDPNSVKISINIKVWF